MIDWCDKCEEMMQPFLDGIALRRRGRRGASGISRRASWCAKRYRFEERLRHYVRVASTEPMSPELKAKLAALRTPLN